MPRLGVNALRWLLLVVNLGALAGVTMLGQSLVRNYSDDQLRLTLPDPEEFVVPPETEQVFDQGQLRAMLAMHNRKLPLPPRPPAPPKEPELEIHNGGPLEAWEIASTTVKDAYRAVQLQESVETVITTGRPTPTRRARNVPPSNRRRASSRTNRSAGRRPTSAGAESQRVRYVREGDEFTIDDKEYTALRITVLPEEEFEYRDAAGRSYKLTREYPELDGVELNDDGKVISLLGQSDEDLGLEVTTPGAANSAVPADEMGSIQRGGGRAPATKKQTPTRQPAAKRQPPGRTPATAEDKKALDKTLNEAKKTGKISPEDQKRLQEASNGLKRSGQ